MENIIEVENDLKSNHIKSLWRKASKNYYERNKERLRAKKLAYYHRKKQL